MTDFTECSVCFWLKINAWNSSYETYFQAGKNGANWADYIFGILRNSSNSTICFTIGNGSSASNNSYITSARTVGEWCHMSFIYSPGKCKIYLNGILDKEYTTTFVPNFAKVTEITIGHSNGNGYQTNCLMNDFRIYDHALSPMEVKQISQGLILHYPLNNNGFGQKNLHKNSDTITSTWSIHQGTVSNGVVTITPSSGSDRRIYQMPANGGWNWESNKTYTASIDARSPNGAILIFYPYGAGSMNKSYTVTSQWKRYSFTFTATQSGTASMTYHVSQTSGVTLQLKHPKLELGQKATPWCPNEADKLYNIMGLNDNIQYDTSGYNHNLKNFNKSSFSSDTPKYNISTELAGTSYGTHQYLFLNDSYQKELTVSCWIKRTSSENTSRYISNSWIVLYLYSDFAPRISWRNSTGTSDIKNTWAPGGAIPINIWTHICFTIKDGIVKYYKNGTYISTSDRTQYGTLIHGSLSNGFGGESLTSKNWIGGLSDFRFYCTALSAEDILALYKNSVYIDNEGNLYGAELREV